ncbi:PIN domain-like protein [Obelidium mucronatum]|nr:PIN domain-like protein [Obelidium mucronatum]
MGVIELWKLLDAQPSVRRIEAFDTLASRFSAAAEYRHAGVPVAVDASMWLHSAAPRTHSFAPPHAHAHSTIAGARRPVSPAIVQRRVLFFRVARTLAAHALPVFVFDFAPHFAAAVASPLNTSPAVELVRLLDALRLKWFVAAPGVSAEAECARLNALGLVSAVMTDDGDAFLFGANTVIRNWSGATKEAEDRRNAVLLKRKIHDKGNWNAYVNGGSDSVEWGREDDDDEELNVDDSSKKSGKSTFGVGTGLGKDYVGIYTMDSVLKACSWNRNALILMAMIGGADGAPGIRGIGLQAASRLCGSGIADKIIPAAVKGDKQALETHLRTFLDQFRTNSLGLLTQKRPSAVKDMDVLVYQLANQWPMLIRQYAVPPTKVDENEQLRDDISAYISGWWKREYTPDTAMIVAWYSKNLEVDLEYAHERVCASLGPILRLRALRIIAYKNHLADSVSLDLGTTRVVHSSTTSTPSRHSNELIACILNEGPSKFGVDQVQVQWTNYAMTIGIPPLSSVPGSHTKGKFERAIMTEEEETAEEWTELRLEKVIAHTKKVWLDQELVYMAAPKIFENWYRGGSASAKGRRTGSATKLLPITPTGGPCFRSTPDFNVATTPTRKPQQKPMTAALHLPSTFKSDNVVISLLSDDEEEDDEYQNLTKKPRYA